MSVLSVSGQPNPDDRLNGYIVGPRTHGPTTVAFSCRIFPEAWDSLAADRTLTGLAGKSSDGSTIAQYLGLRTEVRVMLCKTDQEDDPTEGKITPVTDGVIESMTMAGWDLVCRGIPSDMRLALSPTTDVSRAAREKCSLRLASVLATAMSATWSDEAGNSAVPRYIALSEKTFDSFRINPDTPLQGNELKGEGTTEGIVNGSQLRMVKKAVLEALQTSASVSEPQTALIRSLFDRHSQCGFVGTSASNAQSTNPQATAPERRPPSRKSTPTARRHHPTGLVEPAPPKAKRPPPGASAGVSSAAQTDVSTNSQDSVSGSAPTSPSKTVTGGQKAGESRTNKQGDKQRKAPWNLAGSGKRNQPGAKDVYG